MSDESPSDLHTKPSAPQHKTLLRRHAKKAAIAAVVLVAIIIGLSVGLTLGLRNSDGDDDDASDDNPHTPTTPSLPSPTSRLPWQPSVSDTWQIMLLHPPSLEPSATSISPDVSVYDIDLFDTSVETIATLHKLGKKVICYFSAGSYEPGRPDSGDFANKDIGADVDGWPGEKWIRLGSEGVRQIMKKRVELAHEKGCDGVDPDNVDGFQNSNGLGLTAEDSISFMSYLSNITRPYNLTLGLKNAGDIIESVLPIVQFSVNEQCVQESECETFAAFIEAGKPVFHIEYPNGAGNNQGLAETEVDKYCGNDSEAKGRNGFSTVLKTMELTGWVEYCDRVVQVTRMNETDPGH